MTDDTHLFGSEQWCTAELRIVQAFFQTSESWARKNGTSLCDERLAKLSLQQSHDRLNQSLARLEDYIPREPIGNDYINIASPDIAPFNIPNKVDRRFLEQQGSI